MSIFLQTDLDAALLEAAVGLIAREDTGEVLYATPALEALFGYDMRGELALGKVLADLLPGAPTGQPGWNGWTAVTGRKKDGSTFPVAIGLRGRVISGARCLVIKFVDLTGWTVLPVSMPPEGMPPGPSPEGRA